VVRGLLFVVYVRVTMRRRESPEEARQRRFCRYQLGLPPEVVYHHVGEGVAAVAALSLVLVAVAAWQLDHFATIAPALVSAILLAALTPTVLFARRHYRHVVAGVVTLAVLLALFVAVAQRYGSTAPVELVVGPTPSAIADAVTRR
jgi:hypothetical protein